MGLPYGIQCISQFLLPQLAQLYAGICVPKLRGQLKLFMCLGVGGSEPKAMIFMDKSF